MLRFVQGRDSNWRKHVAQTDEVDTQWRKMMRVLGVEVVYALSPQAKGKIERPYQWLQDRIVRTCAHEGLHQLEEVRRVLRKEVDRYNNHQLHSTTGEIPRIRYEKAMREVTSSYVPCSCRLLTQVPTTSSASATPAWSTDTGAYFCGDRRSRCPTHPCEKM